jgi:hypothetical protein
MTPRRHHLVPKFYLEGFARDDGRIGVIRLGETTSRFVTSVINAAVEVDFYMVETEDGPSADVEEMLSRIEGRASNAIQALLAAGLPLDEGLRADLAIFLGFQALRDRRARDAENQITDFLAKAHLVALGPNQIQTAIEDIEGRSPSEEEIQQQLSFFADHERYKVVQHTNELVRTMLERAEASAAMIATRTWQLLTFDEPSLVTTDSPVVQWQHPDKRGGFYGVGIGTADELRFPVDRHHGLVIAWEAPAGEVTRVGTPGMAAAFNHSVLAGAYQTVFHHPNSSEIDDALLPQPHPPMQFSGLSLDDIAKMRPAAGPGEENPPF